jgi:pyruvate kinase
MLAGHMHDARADADALRLLARQLEELRRSALALEAEHVATLAAIPAERRPSGRNLLHYLALRQHDIRALQSDLAELGLSSLGRLEAHALASIEAVLAAVGRLAGEPERRGAAPPVAFREGQALLAARTAALLGPRPADRPVRVMVTMASEAAEDYALVRDLVAAGMDVMRINCAHDDAHAWARMALHARKAAEEVGRPCRVIADLAGPKLRTGPVEPGPGVLHWWPLRDDTGRVLARASVWLGRAGAPPPSGAIAVPLADALLAALRPGDELHFADARGRRRLLEVGEAGPEGFWAEADRNTYLASHAPVELRRAGRPVLVGRAGELPPLEQSLRLAVGDRLVLTRDTVLGRPAARDADGRTLEPARIGCTLPEAFRDVRAGERVFFDDGKLGGVVREVGRDRLVVEIEQARSGKARLRGDRGINLPDTGFALPALTEKDLRDLDFVVANADGVGLSFVRRPEDVEQLQAELDRRGGSALGIVLKIETRHAFEALPRLLLAALRSPRAGVMVARGDLGVEVGFERLAEVQEEILWLCEAAHVPVVWATQVLETLSKKGMPSRAEVTDAAMGGRAECVMLNKGPHSVEAVRFLCGVLRRMQGHLDKKRLAQRRIASAERSTSAAVVAQLDTEMRAAARPRKVVPPSQQVPSAWMRATTARWKASGSAPGGAGKRTST